MLLLLIKYVRVGGRLELYDVWYFGVKVFVVEFIDVRKNFVIIV